jgi:hypothetical protein
VTNLEEEADQARAENTELYAELSRREGLATELIASQQASYEVLQRAIIEHEVMITAAEMYEKHIAEMQEALVLEERCVDIHESCVVCLMDGWIIYSISAFVRKLYRIETNLEEVTSRVHTLHDAVEKKRNAAENLLNTFEQWTVANEKKEKLKAKVLKVAKKLVAQVVRDADSVHNSKTSSLVGADEDDSLDQSLDSMSMSTCEQASPKAQSEVGSPFLKVKTVSMSASHNYDPETAWKSSHNTLPHISGKIRTAVLKNRSQGTSSQITVT